jgi:hypothetical protein
MAKSKVTTASKKPTPVKSESPNSTSLQTITHRDENSHCVNIDDVRRLAYLKWEAAGKPDCDGTAFWLAAEQESNVALSNCLS